MGDEGGGIGRRGCHFVRAQRGHRIGGVSVRVAADQAVHGKPTAVDHVDDRLEAEHPGEGGERGVLAHRVAGEVRGLLQHALLPQLFDLRVGEHGHGHLRELGEVDHPVRVGEVLAGHAHSARVRPHDVQHGKAQLVPRVPVGAFPHGAGACRCPESPHPHPAVLDALAREGVEGDRGA